MMEHIADPSVLTNDLIAIHPHLSFTIYDEISILLHRLLGLDFQPILVAQQILTRLLGLLGVFLMAQAAGLSHARGVLVTGVFALGATIVGPSVLTFEYEPTPRAMALPLILFAAGLSAIRAWNGAGAAAAVALLYHPPTVLPILFLLALYLLLPWHGESRRERVRFAAWTAGAILILLVASRLQAGVRIEQPLFGVVAPELETLQRMRASYNWVGMWIGQLWLHYAAVFAIAIAAWFRIRTKLTGMMEWLLGGLPVIGVCSLGVSYLWMDQWKWSLMPQLQPARAILWTTFSAVVSCSIAAAHARSWAERIAWMIAPFSIVVLTRPMHPADPLLWTLALALAAVFAFALRANSTWFAAAAVIAAMFAIPGIGRVRNYPALHSADLDALSRWARTTTPPDSLFHFPDAGRELYPGIFRARALRGVWVDWKGGGQVNFVETLAYEWWRRWSTQGAYRPPPGAYIVQKGTSCAQPVFQNASYCVMKQR
jgi:hypothetical protein